MSIASIVTRLKIVFVTENLFYSKILSCICHGPPCEHTQNSSCTLIKEVTSPH